MGRLADFIIYLVQLLRPPKRSLYGVTNFVFGFLSLVFFLFLAWGYWNVGQFRTGLDVCYRQFLVVAIK